MTWIDVHAHLDMLEESPAETLKRAQAAGVQKLITIGTEPSDHEFVLKTAKQFYPDVYCTLGVHPHQGIQWQESVGQWIEDHLSEKEVVAVGEIGLDYYYNQSPVENQREAFRRQLDIAKRHKMPVQIHTREAEQDTIEILREFRGEVTGLIHCFTSSADLAKECLDLGYNISFSGVVTFKNAESLRETCKMVPLDRMHVETDAPFLAPVPQRGKKNTPAFVVHTAALVAQLKEISLEQLAEQTNENARQLFPKIVW
ncbi:MAG: TatD family deoxyribonuclease [Bdellovibrio sp. CG10_big_fil_rev_8_21_14_0_10_47_8]|nr:MAG: TatD family deoxyribonuclease [Bdellovibrio sp. CG10_big_fil_rev_8_21_14_0_10_47_8]